MYNLPILGSSNLPTESLPTTNIQAKDPKAGGTAFYEGGSMGEQTNKNRRKENHIQATAFKWDNTIGQVLDVIA